MRALIAFALLAGCGSDETPAQGDPCAKCEAFGWCGVLAQEPGKDPICGCSPCDAGVYVPPDMASPCYWLLDSNTSCFLNATARDMGAAASACFGNSGASSLALSAAQCMVSAERGNKCSAACDADMGVFSVVNSLGCLFCITGSCDDDMGCTGGPCSAQLTACEYP